MIAQKLAVLAMILIMLVMVESGIQSIQTFHSNMMPVMPAPNTDPLPFHSNMMPAPDTDLLPFRLFQLALIAIGIFILFAPQRGAVAPPPGRRYRRYGQYRKNLYAYRQHPESDQEVPNEPTSAPAEPPTPNSTATSPTKPAYGEAAAPDTTVRYRSSFGHPSSAHNEENVQENGRP